MLRTYFFISWIFLNTLLIYVHLGNIQWSTMFWGIKEGSPDVLPNFTWTKLFSLHWVFQKFWQNYYQADFILRVGPPCRETWIRHCHCLGFSIGGGTNHQKKTHMILPIFQKTAWNWEILGHGGAHRGALPPPLGAPLKITGKIMFCFKRSNKMSSFLHSEIRFYYTCAFSSIQGK